MPGPQPREILEQYGYYTGCVVGGGTAHDCAAYGCFDAVEHFHTMNSCQQEYYRAWANPFHQSVRGSVTNIKGDLFHLWHGDMVNRQGEVRHIKLSQIPFDPYEDLTVGANGCGQWKSDKPRLHEYVRSFFAKRREDG